MGVSQTFLTMGIVYLCFMLVGAVLVRIPAPGWKPAGFSASAVAARKLITTRNVLVGSAWKTPQFALLWLVLFLNVTAGIGILAVASNMIQEMFAPRVTVAAAAGFVGLLSLFNMFGRLFWASMSDYLGRRNTYMIFFALGALLYALLPTLGKSGVIVLFVLTACIILTMYGGGFATIPAYLKDVFGVIHVGAIHGRLLTAWSAAGLVGPQIITYLRKYNLDQGVAKADAYYLPMYVMACLLVAGFVCNYFMSPVHERHYVSLQDAEAAI